MDHGFGTGKLTDNKLTKEPATLKDKEKIAKCISKVEGVLWSHVVHLQDNPRDIYDLIWEEWKKCNNNDIEACVPSDKYKIEIHHTTIKDKSFKKEQEGKHPKKEDG